MILLLMFALSLHCTSTWSANYDTRAIELISEDPAIRVSALMDLSTAANRADARGEPFDFSGKREIFSKLCDLDDIAYVSNAARLLSKLPVDEAVLERAKSILLESTSPGSMPSLVAALHYTRVHAFDMFNAYFEQLTYEEIDADMTQAFIGDQLLIAKRRAYYQGLVESYLAWTPPPNSSDFENPFREKLLEAHRETLGEIFREMYAEPFRAIPLKLIWLWGEMGAIEGVPLLDLLLQEYAERPSPRTAISIGSTLGTLNVTMLGDYGFTGEELRAIWKGVLGTRWPAVKDKSIEQIVAYWRVNWVEVREDCKRRSVPELG